MFCNKLTNAPTSPALLADLLVQRQIVFCNKLTNAPTSQATLGVGRGIARCRWGRPYLERFGTVQLECLQRAYCTL